LGKQAYENTIELNSGVTKQHTENLVSERGAGGALSGSDSGGASWWPWALGGTALAAGLGVGAYFLFKPSDTQAPYTPGTAGTIEVR
jgi:hypothetical protein